MYESALPTGTEGVDFGDVADTYARLTARGIAAGMSNWIPGFIEALIKKQKLSAYNLYMPTFGPLPQVSVATGLKIESIPVNAVFGGPGGKFGSLGGLGLLMGANRQLLRMDWHPFQMGHGGVSGVQAGEVAVLRDGKFHMHVYKWTAFGG